jgi:mannan endo-1,4-beta-mannosidase
MAKKSILTAVLTLIVSAAFLMLLIRTDSPDGSRRHFVETHGVHFMLDGRPFRFVGANTPIIPGQAALAAEAGIKVVRLWALGEGEIRDKDRLPDPPGSPPTYPYRWSPDNWNEEAFRQLDRVIAEAGRHEVLVQLCLTNWWIDTGGVTQYLRWAGIEGADDESYPYGINFERAMLFYTNEETRRMYRQHLEKLATRRNTITGTLYRDDPTIFGWELMNEAQAVSGRWDERRAWLAEMSSYLKSLDPNHLIAAGDWGYRSTVERREWIADHRLPNVDYCDVHLYPIDDEDSFVGSLTQLREFIDNRAAASLEVNKPLVFGEFGMQPAGYRGLSQLEWFRSFFERNAAAGAGGAMFWILTPDPKRRYSVTPTERDEKLMSEITRASWLFDSYQTATPPARLTERQRYLVPHQIKVHRVPGDSGVLPKIILQEDRTVLYRFAASSVTSGQFEKLGEGSNYIWGSGAGYFEYIVPERADRRWVSQIIVRARLQPVVPSDARPESIKTRVNLFVSGYDCGSRLIPVEDPKQPAVQEWRVDNFLVRLRAMRGLPIAIRFSVAAEADWPYGVNISTWPPGHDSGERTPVEVEVRR